MDEPLPARASLDAPTMLEAQNIGAPITKRGWRDASP
jgi:hypothetical protein